MARAKLSSALPGTPDANGLNSIAEQMATEPEAIRTAIVLLDTRQVTINTDDPETAIPTARIKRIEPIERRDDLREAHKLLRRAHEERTGKTVLPYDLEGDLDDAFDTGGNQ